MGMHKALITYIICNFSQCDPVNPAVSKRIQSYENVTDITGWYKTTQIPSGIYLKYFVHNYYLCTI